jgi:hypothetical protein
VSSNPVHGEVLDTTLCDNVCQWLVTGQWFSPGSPVSSTNKTDCHDITEILLKVALNIINLTKGFSHMSEWKWKVKHVCLVSQVYNWCHVLTKHPFK